LNVFREFGRDGLDVASVQVGYMLNLAQLKRRIIFCVTFALKSKKKEEAKQ
jgi:hypothetical protein